MPYNIRSFIAPKGTKIFTFGKLNFDATNKSNFEKRVKLLQCFSKLDIVVHIAQTKTININFFVHNAQHL